MRIKIFYLLAALFVSIGVFAQKKLVKVEVLYFKAQLSCCQDKTCNAIETDVKKIMILKHIIKIN